MFASQVVVGRTFVAVLEPGDDVLDSLAGVCARFGVDNAYIPVFLGAFAEITVIGAEHPPPDEDEPLQTSVVVRNCEGLGSGTVARGPEGPLVHLHVTVGAKGDSARATAGHVLAGTVQYPTEVIITEIVSPVLSRRPNDRARGLATLTFDAS
ncbi:PPC domain-containing DNA-binding protein [Herbiconiux ginsengi]|uniref:Predicted DNA-binding protein with PD1-like DNA-binding motif n=1 Tax=Herbiconiux ginsengi TaxID=381665 RepID=A0A1H3TW21_9MICO|nr:PPC domain-containing DNA-binding protein [Herbiconiux ginsengi]SDZ54302.1 Predicted DNA-binding protein with PD1-like DNA-binding motif [Herbiconiux ginsengi]